ncbi:SCO family protein [Herbaspirillum autotrophicum]|uniref:SCO family protein n=1 Tax=Herbaspirillum autotrophicum TaxID=180195 RepID=UPI00067D72CE|nr:SCO family protein [Herbaspirillum autotrophicum]
MPRLKVIPLWLTTVACIIITCIATLLFADVTRGFQTVTSDGARRIDLARAPRPLPEIQMITSDGRRLSLATLVGTDATSVITLIYTQCLTICRSTVGGQSYLQAQWQRQPPPHPMRLLTISFDPQRDTPQVMRAYAQKMRVDPALWHFATVANADDLPRLLKLFDIVVLPDGRGDYVHNAALFTTDAKARLNRAWDIDQAEQVWLALNAEQ